MEKPDIAYPQDPLFKLRRTRWPIIPIKAGILPMPPIQKYLFSYHGSVICRYSLVRRCDATPLEIANNQINPSIDDSMTFPFMLSSRDTIRQEIADSTKLHKPIQVWENGIERCPFHSASVSFNDMNATILYHPDCPHVHDAGNMPRMWRFDSKEEKSGLAYTCLSRRYEAFSQSTRYRLELRRS